MNAKVWYLAGPMTGYPKFNFPAFFNAAKTLRSAGYVIISPAELDQEDGTADKAMQSAHGDLKEVGITQTWADLLARDVKLIADKVYGIIFLDGWEKSKGARLEAFVGLLTGRFFARYLSGGGIELMSRQTVLAKIMRATSVEIKNDGA